MSRLSRTTRITPQVDGPESVVGTSGNDTIAGGTGNDTLLGQAGNDILEGNADNDQLFGSAGLDSLYGGDGNDLLSGGTDNDKLSGSAGNDTIYGGDGDDQLWAAGRGAHTDANEALDAVGAVNYLYGDAGEDDVFGAEGNDRLDGGADNDYLFGWLGNDTLLGGGGSDYLITSPGDDSFNGGDGDDFMVLGDFHNYASRIVATGGAGADRYSYDIGVLSGFIQYASVAAPQRITDFNSAEGDVIDFLETNGNFNDRTLVWRGAADAAFTGTVGQSVTLAGTPLDPNRFYEFWTFYDATLGRTVLFVDRNSDQVVDGNDIRIEFDGVVALGTSAFNTGAFTALIGTLGNDANAVFGFTAGNDVAHGLLGNDTLAGVGGNDTLHGDEGNDNLNGGDGDDSIEAGIGADTLYGGAGGDKLHADATGTPYFDDPPTDYDAAGTINILYGGAGNDTLLGGLGDDRLYGEADADTLLGGDGADILDGGAGVDSMQGGDGNDLYYADTTGDVVTEAEGEGIDYVVSTAANYTLGANIETLRLLNNLAANGIGNALDNLIYAGNGNNVINGGAGSDTVSYFFATSAINVTLALVTAQTTGGSGTDTIASIENLFGSNYNDTLTGNVHANTLSGGAGDDTLDGGSGADRLVGGAGADTYYVDTPADLVTETDATPAGGIDTVISSAANAVLTANVENLRLTNAGAANGTGNALDNIIHAGSGNNALNGGAGVDTLSYAYATTGVRLYLGQHVAQNTYGSGYDIQVSFENLTGSAFNDELGGDASGNVIDGGAGADYVLGSDGADTLTGGAGADDFTYMVTGESTLAVLDTIVDFSHAEGDRIVIDHIDANLALAGDQQFSFIGSAAFGADATGQLRYESGMVYASTDADSDAEFAILIGGAPALVAADFVL